MTVRDEMDEVLQEFLVESHENLDRLDREFVTLEKDPRDQQILASIFRTIHTIKGTAGFLGLGKLEALTHVGESLLSRLRDAELTLDTEMTNALLAMVDAVRLMLGNIAATGAEGDVACEHLIELLTRLQTSPAERAVASPAAPTLSAEASETIQVVDSSVRVDIGLLDKLMNLVGELVLARNQVLQFTTHAEDATLAATSQRLNLITTELQEGVMKTRMQPIGLVWNKFPRIVRDLAAACGKQVEMTMHGPETELDRTIIEAIKDPLTHLVRNAVDHGIESPADRAARGKPPVGHLQLRAFHEGGQVNIEMSDDGGGIDLERVKAKAVAGGLVSREQADRMTEREIANLIFVPGFSTAERLSNISGRGVGMDVVKTNIERIGGTVDISSRMGTGTTIKIKIPLTLAIIPALIVTSDGDRYAIPQVSLLELVRLDGDEARKRVESVNGVPVYRLRGNLLPLVHLRDLFRRVEHDARSARRDEAAINIVVLQAGDQQFGLVVAGINDTEEIVVKPLGKQLKGIPAFAGATIMGDGKVALILDVLGIAQHVKLVSDIRERRAILASTTRDDSRRAEQMLLCAAGRDGRVAIPLAAVDRLEEFATETFERAGHDTVIQYRGQIMPLAWLQELLPLERRSSGSGTHQQVVVYRNHGRTLGLVVDKVLDIVEEHFTVDGTSARPGIRGTAVIQGRVTEIVDVNAALDAIAGPTRQTQSREMQA